MSHRSVEKLLPRSGGSVYRLIRMAAGRALEISEGNPSLINNSFGQGDYYRLGRNFAG